MKLEESKPKFVRRVVVRCNDLDELGHVRMSQLIHWMEETEYEFLRSRGLSVSLRDHRGQFGFPRLSVKASIDLWPVVDEQLEVRLVLETMDLKSLAYTFEIIRLSTSAEERIGTGAYAVACCRFPDGQLPFPILIPDWVFEKLSHAAGTPSGQMARS